jgi:Na+/H+-translocating membrane pyrophosphatase
MFSASFSDAFRFFGLWIAFAGSAKTANAAEMKDEQGICRRVPERSVMGLCTAGLGLLGIVGGFVYWNRIVVCGYGSTGRFHSAQFSCASADLCESRRACAVLIGKGKREYRV